MNCNKKNNLGYKKQQQLSKIQEQKMLGKTMFKTFRLWYV